MGVRSVTMCPAPPRTGTPRGPCPLFYILLKSVLWQIWRRRKTRLILRTTGIDVLIPQQDTSRHAFHIGEPILPQKLRKLHRPASATAMHHDLLVLMLLERANVLADLLKRNQLGAV